MKSFSRCIWEVFSHGIEPLKSHIKAIKNRQILYLNPEDFIFEGREKSYGAYVLHKDYHWHLMTAVGFVGGVCLNLAFLPVLLG